MAKKKLMKYTIECYLCADNKEIEKRQPVELFVDVLDGRFIECPKYVCVVCGSMCIVELDPHTFSTKEEINED